MTTVLAVLFALQSPRVTITEPGITVGKLLEKIGPTVGRDYRVAASLGSDIVCVRLADVEREDFEAHLSQTLGAEWRPSGETYRLEPSATFAREERTRLIASQRRGLERTRKELNARLSATPVLTAEVAQKMLRRVGDRMDKNQGNSEFGISDAVEREATLPIKRLLGRLMAVFPDERLVGLPALSRVVYSSQPNIRQTSFPVPVDGILQSFRREQSVWETAQATVKTAAGSALQIDGLPPKYKVLFVVEGQPGGRTIYASVEIVDLTGKVVLSSVAGLEDWDPDRADAWRQKLVAEPGESPVEEGRLATQLRRACQRSREDPASEEELASIAREFGPVIRNPARYEPLAIIPGALWTAMATQKGTNLLGYMTDEDFPNREEIDKGPRTPSMILKRLRMQHVVTDQDGWTTIRPEFLGEARSFRADREALGTLVRRAIDAGGFEIEDAAEFRRSQPQGYPFYAWPTGYLFTFHPHVALKGALEHSIRTEELRFYGTLTAQQRLALRQGPLAMAAMPKLQGLLNELVYSGGWGTNFGRYEATELYPDGLPSGIRLRLIGDTVTTAAQPVIAGQVDRSYYPLTYGAQTLGAQMLVPSNASWTGYRLVRERTLHLRLEFLPGITQEIRLQSLLEDDNPPVAYDKLPGDFRREVEASRKAAEGRPKRGQVIPPR